jgi:hypothetical protein
MKRAAFADDDNKRTSKKRKKRTKENPLALMIDIAGASHFVPELQPRTIPRVLCALVPKSGSDGIVTRGGQGACCPCSAGMGTVQISKMRREGFGDKESHHSLSMPVIACQPAEPHSVCYSEELSADELAELKEARTDANKHAVLILEAASHCKATGNILPNVRITDNTNRDEIAEAAKAFSLLLNEDLTNWWLSNMPGDHVRFQFTTQEAFLDFMVQTIVCSEVVWYAGRIERAPVNNPNNPNPSKREPRERRERDHFFFFFSSLSNLSLRSLSRR